MSKNDIHNTNKTVINVHLDMEYNTYKKKIKKYIFEHIEIIFNIFTEEFNDNLIMFYILLKKKILEEQNIKYINSLIDIIKYMSSLEYIDQEEYFNIIIKLVNINILINIMKKTQLNNKYLKLIDFRIINDKIIECINLISKENVILELFLIFINKHNTNTQNNIIYMSEKLSLDFFMYWSSEDIYELITKNISSKNNVLLMSLKKYKNEFINTYNQKSEILKKLYNDQINAKYSIKYKLNIKNKLFNELIKDMDSINNKFEKEKSK